VDSINNVLGRSWSASPRRRPTRTTLTATAKFESLGVLAVGRLPVDPCFELVRSAVQRLTGGGHAIEMSTQGLVLLVRDTRGKFVAVREPPWSRVVERALHRDAAATRTDVFVTVGVLIGVLFSRKGYLW